MRNLNLRIFSTAPQAGAGMIERRKKVDKLVVGRMNLQGEI